MQLDKQFLTDLGLTDLNEQEEAEMLSSLADSLQMKVGMAISLKLTDEQLDKVPEEMTEEWLQKNVPDYKEIARAELAKMKQELLKQNEKMIDKDN